MGWIEDLPAELEGDDVEKCSFCGNDAVAFWSGNKMVSTCRNCAIRILPRLIADAVTAAHSPGRRSAETCWKDVTSQFYKSATFAHERYAKRQAKKS